MWGGRFRLPVVLAMIAMLCSGETLDDAVRSLAKNVSTRLRANEVAHVTARNLSSMSAGEVSRASATLDRALRRRVRNPAAVEVAFTVSENLKGYLLVAEIHGVVEMVSFHLDPPAPPVRSAVVIEKRIVWEQDVPILDLAVMGDQMLVLDTTGVTRYERRTGKWEKVELAPTAVAAVRDPRGRLEVTGDSLAAYLPGGTCRGTWKPVELRCEAGTSEFMLDQHAVHFAPARNTLEAAEWPAGGFETWGSDFAPIESSCAGHRVAASGTGAWDAADFVALYDVVSGAAVRVSDAVEFPGPVTALWPSLAVVRNLSTGRYEAYSLTVDCGR
jgi:hypothetical protein